MKRTKAKRLLVPEATLTKLELLLKMGVKLSTAIKNEGLPGTPPVYKKLLNHYTMFQQTQDPTIHASLFPPWVGKEQPSNAVYNGYFPLGYWTYENN